MQLILPRCGHVANQNHACQKIQVRLNEEHFGLKSDRRVPNCSNSPGGWGMPLDILTHVPCTTLSVQTAQCRVPQKVNKLYMDMRCSTLN